MCHGCVLLPIIAIYVPKLTNLLLLNMTESNGVSNMEILTLIVSILIYANVTWKVRKPFALFYFLPCALAALCGFDGEFSQFFAVFNIVVKP